MFGKIIEKEEKKEVKRPICEIYSVRDRKNSDKGVWTKIGAMWETDGEVFMLSFEVTPIELLTGSCRLVAKPPKSQAS